MSSATPSASQLEPLVKRLQKIDTQLTGRTGTAAGSSLNDLVASLEAIASSLGSLHDLQSVLLRIEAADTKIRQQPTSTAYPHTMTEVLQRLECVGPAAAQIPTEYQQKPTTTPAATAKPTPSTPAPAPTSTPIPTSTPAAAPAPAPVKPASPAVKPTPAPAAAPEPVKADGQKTTPTPTPTPAPAKASSPSPTPASSVPTAGRCPKNGTLVCHCNDKPKPATTAHGGSGSAYGVNKPASTPAATPAAAAAASVVAPKPAAPAPVAAASSTSASSSSSSSSSSSGPFYSHDQLKTGLPAGVDAKNKEMHLEDHVFESLFKMTKEAWGKVAGWKKEIEKKKHGLF